MSNLLHLLADVTLPDPKSAESIGWISLMIFCLVGGVNSVLKLTDRFKEKPPAYQVYATKDEHGQLKLHVGGLEKKIEDKSTDLIRKFESDQKDIAKKFDEELGRERGSRKRIHEEITEIQTNIKGLQTINEAQSRALIELTGQCSRLDERVDLLPERLVNLLKSTKGLIT